MAEDTAERSLWPVEEYFGVKLRDLDRDDEYEDWLYRIMIRIEVDYENGQFDIDYYAAMYGF
jgi:hypothetical protein